MKCTYCQRDTIVTKSSDHHDLKRTRDHVIPRSKGGLDIASNRVIACGCCNQIKGNMMPDEWATFMATNPGWWIRAEKLSKRKQHVLNPPRMAEADEYEIIGQLFAKNVAFGRPIRRRRRRPNPTFSDRKAPLVCPVITMVAEFFYLRRYPYVEPWAQQQTR